MVLLSFFQPLEEFLTSENLCYALVKDLGMLGGLFQFEGTDFIRLYDKFLIKNLELNFGDYSKKIQKCSFNY